MMKGAGTIPRDKSLVTILHRKRYKVNYGNTKCMCECIVSIIMSIRIFKRILYSVTRSCTVNVNFKYNFLNSTFGKGSFDCPFLGQIGNMVLFCLFLFASVRVGLVWFGLTDLIST